MTEREVRRRRLEEARLYCCTDGRGSLAAFEAFIESIVRGGVDIVQLRDKDMEARDALAYLEVLTRVTRRLGALSCMNDRADLAALAGVDIVHVGQDDLTAAQARAIVGPDVLIGRSTHAPEEARQAMSEDDVDYFAVGPVWPTPTKPGRAAPGLEFVRAVAQLAPAKPWFAIGGVDLDRIPAVAEAGATRVVVVRALTGATEPGVAATDLRRTLADVSRA